MTYGPVSLGELITADVVAPGMPGFLSVKQSGNNTIKLLITIPSADSDNSPLTGLAKLTVVTAMMLDGINPFVSLSMPEILALSGIALQDVTLSPDSAGTQVEVEMPIVNLGGTQAFAAACCD